MIHGGNTTLYVADINASIRFYTETLGLELRMRAEDNWAEIDAGPGLLLGLHPAREGQTPDPDPKGTISVGFNVTGALEEMMQTLQERGVAFLGPIVEGRKENLDRRTPVWLAVHPDIAAALLDDPVGRRQTEPGALVGTLGSEERVECPAAHRGAHPAAVVAKGQPDIVPGSDDDLFADHLRIQRDVRGLDEDPAAAGHGLPRVDGEIQQDLHQL